MTVLISAADKLNLSLKGCLRLVFIGIDMDDVRLYDSLQQCLLTDAEMRLGPAQWRNFADPFPIWNKTVEEVLSQS